MKKIMVCVGALLLLAACASQETKTTSADDARTEELRQMARGYGTYYYKDPLILAVLKNDVQGVKQALVDRQGDEGKMVSDGHLRQALGVCEPYRQASKFENFKVECDETKDPDIKKKNAEIIGLLVQNSDVDVNKLEFTRLDGNTRYVALTYAGKAKEWNPLAVKYFLPKMDKCLAALSQMQNADDSKPNYYVYADYWRNNNCSITEQTAKITWGSEMMQTLFKLIGTDKQAVEKAFGKTPTVYEHPSEHREVLTYKKVETKEGGGTVGGQKGEFKNYYTYAHDYVFTIDRGVVTNVQDIITSKTSFGKTTTQTLEDIKKQDLQDRQNKAGHVVDRRGVIIK
ncbi:MAG: hypothetical protein J6U96_00705 [Elusimicrobiaceae bacterium]|nr:hypothetical protein [Elusimicrobiaceae bacterium]